MSDPVRWTGSMPATRQQASAPQSQSQQGGTDLADILERVLDKGIVIAGDIQINLLDIELLTIKLRLVVASVDRAKEMGIDWWERDPTLSSGHRELEDENRRLRERLEALEKRGLPVGEDEPDDELDDELDAPEDDAPEDDAPEDDEPEDDAPDDVEAEEVDTEAADTDDAPVEADTDDEDEAPARRPSTRRPSTSRPSTRRRAPRRGEGGR